MLGRPTLIVNANSIARTLMAFVTVDSYIPKDVAPIRAFQVPNGIHITLDGDGSTWGPSDFIQIDDSGESTAFIRGYAHDQFLEKFVVAPA